jgi:hypothetical protein
MKQSPAVVSTATTPGSLLSQYQLLRAVIDAPWATRLDHKITSHVVDRYFGKYEVARASLRYLEQATGATRTNIIESIRRLIEQGVISVTRQGIGTRPTEYGLNFEFAKNNNRFAINNNSTAPLASGPVDDTANNSRGPSDDTSNDASSGPVGNTATSGIVDDTSSGPVGDTSSGSSGIVHGTESYLLNRLTSRLKVSRNDDAPAVPTAPPVSGLEADTAATAVDPKDVAASDLPLPRTGFDELWAVFPRKHDRSKAQAAYKKLAPDTDLHNVLVEKAAAWAEHYRQSSTEPKWWKHLHNWLVEERYLEDLPVLYENPKEAAIVRARESGPRKANKPLPAAKATGLSPKTPIGRHKVKVVGTDMPDSNFAPEVRMKFCFRIEEGDHTGTEFSHTFKIVSGDENEQFDGQSIYANIRNATGLLEPDDTSDFHDKVFHAVVGKMGRIEYAA